MDSFYDAPRPTSPPLYSNRVLAPVVPDVSMICPSNLPTQNGHGVLSSYAMWKTPVPNGDTHFHNKENNMNGLRQLSPQNAYQLMKKQVRFESPEMQQRPSLTYEPFQSRKTIENNLNQGNSFENIVEEPTKIVKKEQINGAPYSGNNFHQMYMANIPTRQLDLSMMDPKINSQQLKQSNEQSISSQNLPKTYKEYLLTNQERKIEQVDLTKALHTNKVEHTYKEFRENKKNEGDNFLVTDIFNYRSPRTASPVSRLQQLRKSQSPNNNEHSNETSPLESRKLLQQLMQQKIECTTNKNPCEDNRNVLKDLKTRNQEKESRHVESSVTPKRKGQVSKFTSRETLPVTPYRNTTNQRNAPAENNIPLKLNERQPFILPSKANPLKQIRETEAGESLKSDTCTQTSQIQLVQKQPPENIQQDEPSVKDLLKIIQQQNQQLITLQKQVATLLDFKENNQKQIEYQPPQVELRPIDKYVTSTQHEPLNPGHNLGGTPRKAKLSKFSIDLMTSFEVSFRPQQNYQRKHGNFLGQEPKIQEIVDTENDDKRTVETSMHLQEPIDVRESCPSPEPSIKINMIDYDSSDSDDGESSTNASEIGVTFYRNLMDQINNILHKAQVQTNEEYRSRGCSKPVVTDQFKNKTMNKVKEATVKHLKRIGVNLPPVEDITEISESDHSQNYNVNEISFAVKQLLMKYLPSDHLAKITLKQTQHIPARPLKDKIVLNQRAPDFSMATVEYMKKYKLLENNDRGKTQPFQIPKGPTPVPKTLPKSDNPKFLDISKLKQQPKFL